MKLRASEDRFVDSVRLGDSPKSLVFDSSNRLWVLCEGNIYPEETAGSLWCLNPEDLSVLYQADFAGGEHPGRLNIRKQGADTLYFLKGGVYKMPLNNFQVPASPFIAENNRLFYGLGVDASGNIWVSDAKDYVQPGDVYHYNASGTQQASYKTGIIPSGFVFY
jgi:sugar lactone lactonase YvrE